MIRLTRLRNDSALFLNPDHIERLDHHHDTVVHLFNGTEYIVTETPAEIVELVMMQRARILAVASRLAADLPDELVARAAIDPANLAGADTSGAMTSMSDDGDDHNRDDNNRDDNIWAPSRGER